MSEVDKREEERQRLRSWLEGIGSPEKIIVRVVTGRYGEDPGPTVLLREVGPKQRPEQVFADEILDRVDGDYAALAGPYAVKYAVVAKHFGKSPEEYDRFLIRRESLKKRNGT